MNCEGISRILDTRDVNAISLVERRACETHAAACPHCGPEWLVYTRLAALPTPAMPRQLAMHCEAVAGAGGNARPRARMVLLGAALVIAAAAAMLVAQLTGAPPQEIAANNSVTAHPTSGTVTAAAAPALVPASPLDNAAPPATVLLVLDQATNDATGRDYGQQVYEHAREELRTLPGLVLVDGGAETVAPAFRITYLNLAQSRGSGEALSVQVELVFEVAALRPGADGKGMYQPVFRSSPPPPGVVDMPLAAARQQMIPSFEDEPLLFMSSARMSARPANWPTLPADCNERRERRCPYTAADVAAFTILSWHLQTKSPDPPLVARLHAMLRDPSTPPGLWFMALLNLRKYGKLHLEVPELLAASQKVGTDDPALYEELVRGALNGGSRLDLMRQVREMLLGEQPVGSASAAADVRERLVMLLATELSNEPGARSILEAVADTDPESRIRAAANRAIGVESESQRQPASSSVGRIEDQ